MLRKVTTFTLLNIRKNFVRNVYKSRYNVDNLYPNSGVEKFTTNSNDTEKKFTGEIPIKKLSITYTKSSGPGGQHVNKTNSKAQVRFHVSSSDWIPENVRSKILELFQRRITKDGDLIVQCDASRYQQRNVETCVSKIKEMIDIAQKPPDEAKKKAREALLNEESLARAAEKRLKKKRLNSYTKSMRKVGWED